MQNVKITLSAGENLSPINIYINLTRRVRRTLKQARHEEPVLIREIIDIGTEYHAILDRALREQNNETWEYFVTRALRYTSFPEMLTASPASHKQLMDLGINSLMKAQVASDPIMVYIGSPSKEERQMKSRDKNTVRSHAIRFDEKTVTLSHPPLFSRRKSVINDLIRKSEKIEITEQEGNHPTCITFPFTSMDDVMEACAMDY